MNGCESVDFVILYEHRNRELLGVCLLKKELERRGYTVRISNIYYWRKAATAKRHKAKVLVVPFLYDNNDVSWAVAAVKNGPDKIVNLQCEQIRSQVIRENKKLYPKENAKEFYHVCWSQKQKEYLAMAGIREDRLLVTGLVDMDFTRQAFRPFFETKEELARLFGIDPQKKWCLFISSFTITSYEEEKIANITSRFGDIGIERRKENAVQSRQVILRWIEDFLQNNPGYVFIYRPHPSEVANLNFGSLAQCPNFYCVAELDIKPWIMASDLVHNWFSSGVVSAHYLNKPCSTLRPYSIETEYDNELLTDTSLHITTREGFEEFCRNPNSFGQEKLGETIEEYVWRGEVPAYQLLADALEAIYKEPGNQRGQFPAQGPSKPLGLRLTHWFKRNKYRLLCFAASHLNLTKLYKQEGDSIDLVRAKECYHVEQEIEAIEEKLNTIVG